MWEGTDLALGRPRTSISVCFGMVPIIFLTFKKELRLIPSPRKISLALINRKWTLTIQRYRRTLIGSHSI